MQVYDLAWSPTGEYMVSGSTDNVARIFLVSEGNNIFFWVKADGIHSFFREMHF